MFFFKMHRKISLTQERSDIRLVVSKLCKQFKHHFFFWEVFTIVASKNVPNFPENIPKTGTECARAPVVIALLGKRGHEEKKSAVAVEQTINELKVFVYFLA